MNPLSHIATQLEETTLFGVLTHPFFHYKNLDITLFSLISTLLIIVIGFTLAQIFKRKTLTTLGTVSIENRVIISNLGYYSIIFITLMMGLQNFGIDLSSFAIVAGALSVGIGFGLQNIVSNFMAGIILIFEKSIRVGDVVELDKNIRGKIVDIKMRSTTLLNADNVTIIVPNSNFIQNVVTNTTTKNGSVRVHAPFTLRHGAHINTSFSLLLEKMSSSSLGVFNDDPTKKPSTVVSSLVEKGVECELLFYIASTSSAATAKSEALKIIYETLEGELI